MYCISIYIQLRQIDVRVVNLIELQSLKLPPIYFYDMTTERDTFHYYYSPRKHKKGGGLIVSFLCIFYCASSVLFAGTAEVAIRMSGILSNFDFPPSL